MKGIRGQNNNPASAAAVMASEAACRVRAPWGAMKVSIYVCRVILLENLRRLQIWVLLLSAVRADH